MPPPYRMNEVWTVITPLIRSEETKDKDYREQNRKKYDSDNTQRIKGQVFFNKKDEREFSSTGDQDNSLGRVTFKNTRLTAADFTPRKGDLFTEIAGKTVRYRIIEVRPTAHLNGISNTTRCVFIEDEYERKSL